MAHDEKNKRDARLYDVKEYFDTTVDYNHLNLNYIYMDVLKCL